ncbi:MAG TPA: 2Fe-2S iron-sulfur cluster-binding protein [Cyclobacteriaceae bacterium]|nr:2Fe-2S iron-sulfur cluster-binding protein [Cyclobacteriaceae bacterium]
MEENTVHVNIIDREGLTHRLEAPTDMNMNIMEVCKSYDLPVEGTCGGMALCASCQCYVECDIPLPEQSEAELAMLAEAFHVRDSSRLGCQIRITKEIDGIVLRLAPK